MTEGQVRSLPNTAIESMVEADSIAGAARKPLQTSETNITAHLREAMSALVSPQFQVDHTYNRAGTGEEVKFSRTLRGNVVPDIIVHMRGTRKSENANANELVCEVKKLSSFDGRVALIRNVRQKELLERDLAKLAAFQDRNDQYQYRHAAAIVFANDAVWVKLNAGSFRRLLKL